MCLFFYSVSNSDQWLQVEFDRVENITGLLVQGSPMEDKWVSKLMVSTSQDGSSFTNYADQNSGAPKVFTGNADGQTLTKLLFDREVLARFVRVHPVEWSTGGIALRINILGCERTHVTVTLPQGTGSTVPAPIGKANLVNVCLCLETPL